MKIPYCATDTFAAACIFFLSVLTCACSTSKPVTYFKDIPDSVSLYARNIRTASYTDPVIQPSDILQVSILTMDPQLSTILNASNPPSFAAQPAPSSGPVSGAATQVTGFLVDRKGTIELPVIGKIKVSGMTTSTARDAIHERVAGYYKDPVVNVRFANFNITVLGEVARPATYVVPNEKINLLDAIGMAGDLTIFGKRDNVLLIRDSAGYKQSVRFNLNSSGMFSSPYFYLKQGDVIYIEPAKSKVTAANGTKTRTFAIIASTLSLLIVIFSKL